MDICLYKVSCHLVQKVSVQFSFNWKDGLSIFVSFSMFRTFVILPACPPYSRAKNRIKQLFKGGRGERERGGVGVVMDYGFSKKNSSFVVLYPLSGTFSVST